MNFKKLAPKIAESNQDRDKFPELRPETLNADTARAVTNAYGKVRATALIIEAAQAGKSLAFALCDGPEFIAYFEKKGFKVKKIEGGSPGSVIIEW